MTKVVFENATLVSALNKAASVSPKKGAAFDKASGIVLEVRGSSTPPVVVVKSTNLDVYYMEWVDLVSCDGPDVSWRIPSHMFASVIGSLPLGQGQTAELEDNDGKLHLKSGRMKSKFNTMDVEYYPPWSAFNTEDLREVKGFGKRIKQVEWAASKTANEIPLSGIHFDGEFLTATDRYRLVRVPFKIELGLDMEPFTIPAGMFGTLFTNTDEVMVGADRRQILIMPDEYTQIRAIVYDAEYPPVTRIMKTDQPTRITVKKQDLLDVINRATLIVGSERFPTLKLYFGKGEIAAFMENPEVGMLGDVVVLGNGQAEHNRVEIRYTPKNILDAIENAPSEQITIGYNPDEPDKPMHIDGGSGYNAWVVPRKAGQ